MDDARALCRLGLKLHAGFDVGDALEVGSLNRLDELRIFFAVPLRGGDCDDETIADAFTCQRIFKAWG